MFDNRSLALGGRTPFWGKRSIGKMAWLRRASIVPQIIGWVEIALFIIGIPGHIDDGTTWARWVALVVEPPVFGLAICFVISGPLLWTSGWWFPRLVERTRRQNAPLAVIPVLNQPDEDLARFRECLPHIYRCRELIGPYTGTLGTFNIALQVFEIGSAKFGQIATELEYLAKQLSVLGIPSPEIWGDGNTSFDKVRCRLRSWSSHLARLEAKIHQEDLEGARF